MIVENEWGTIEEITATYVVVKLWDLRRLIVPLSYFIETQFQNWSLIRDRLAAIVKESPYWDGKVVNLQVTNAKEQTVELRCLMSAPSAGAAFAPS